MDLAAAWATHPSIHEALRKGNRDELKFFPKTGDLTRVERFVERLAELLRNSQRLL